MTASIQVTEALKLLMNKASFPNLIRFNLWTNTFDTIKVTKNQSCAVCTSTTITIHSRHESPSAIQFTVSKCTTRAGYSAKPQKNISLNLKKIKEQFNTLIATPIVLVVEEDGHEIIVHNFGELLFKDISDEKKIKQLAEKIYRVGIEQ
jgi:predicted DsbA family dithiol-disulfide isomerase